MKQLLTLIKRHWKNFLTEYKEFQLLKACRADKDNFHNILTKSELMTKITNDDEKSIKNDINTKPLYKSLFNSRITEYTFLDEIKQWEEEHPHTKTTYSYLP